MNPNDLIQALEDDAAIVGARPPKLDDDIRAMLLAALYEDPCADVQS